MNVIGLLILSKSNVKRNNFSYANKALFAFSFILFYFHPTIGKKLGLRSMLSRYKLDRINCYINKKVFYCSMTYHKLSILFLL